MAARSQIPANLLSGNSVSKAVTSRLSLYLRELQHLVRDGHDTTSSKRLGEALGITGAQVRKDLANFGQFGYPGVGYRCQELIGQIKKILGTNRPWTVALVGIGNLGRALLGYRGFIQQGFHVGVAFDIDPAMIGSTIEGIEVFGMERMGSVISHHEIKLAALAVPAGSAQQVADQLVEAGITGLLNFAPVTLALPGSVHLVEVDLAIELEQLSFAVVNRQKKN
ncbi:MAG: redox-sensing transcriptional repressor Rex [Pirellulaceae bacterium]